MALEFNKDSSDLLEMVEIKKKLKKDLDQINPLGALTS
jgi:hypothetical protein